MAAGTERCGFEIRLWSEAWRNLRAVKKPSPISNSCPNSQPGPFRKSLLTWYDAHARDLPWRASRDPYRVWLSEIMLQQTRVAAVIEHYHEFLRRFPTVEKLAAAREASVLAAWSGLGYYRRARMLHAAAKVIVREHGGKLPANEPELRTLPGIGRYTAAAIASIAFGEPVAVVDGNVERVLQRILGKRLSDEELWTAAGNLLDTKRPGDFNQAMMELGATVCTPRSPACLTCPVTALCATRGELPALAKPAPQKKRAIHYAVSYRNGNGRGREVFLIQRSPTASLMAGMWELPERVGTNGSAQPVFTLRHSITVTDYAVKVWKTDDTPANAGKWIPANKLSSVALTGLARKILRKAEML
jgi:A/G-specific adenine glycosylase